MSRYLLEIVIDDGDTEDEYKGFDCVKRNIPQISELLDNFPYQIDVLNLEKI